MSVDDLIVVVLLLYVACYGGLWAGEEISYRMERRYRKRRDGEP